VLLLRLLLGLQLLMLVLLLRERCYAADEIAGLLL
jgi:hypothetical protein